MRFKIVYGIYTNTKCGFASPVVLRKIMAKVMGRCNLLLIWIKCLAWSKISFKFIAQDFLCWLLSCLFFISWISAQWSCYMPLCVNETFLLDLYKPEKNIYLHVGLWRFWRGCRFFVALVIVNLFTGCKAIISKRFGTWSTKAHWVHPYFNFFCKSIISSESNKRKTKARWVHPL